MSLFAIAAKRSVKQTVKQKFNFVRMRIKIYNQIKRDTSIAHIFRVCYLRFPQHTDNLFTLDVNSDSMKVNFPDARESNNAI